MERSVVVFHIGRSGSRVLGKLLGQHPLIQWEGEVLKSSAVDAFRSGLEDPSSYDAFDRLSTLSADRGKRWLGIEVKFYHLRQNEVALDEFVSRVAEMGCRHFVVLTRRNFLRKVVSSVVASETRNYHRPAGDAPRLHAIRLDPDRVNIDAESKPLLEFLDSYRDDFERLASLLEGRGTLSLSFEDDIMEDPRRANAKVCEHLGLEVHEPDIPFGRTNPFPLSEIVTNLDAVRRRLDGTPYAWMAE